MGDETPEQRLARLATRQKEKQRRRKKVIFRGLKMFLNREVPVELLDFSIKAFHGTTAWESHPASPFDVHSASITHHVIDRPLPKSQRIAGRTYVQPQWIFDSINAGFLLPTEWYAPGARLPPHVSPFEIYQKGDHVPEQVKTVQNLKDELFAHEEVKAMKAQKKAARDAQNERSIALNVSAEKKAQVYADELIAEQLGVTYTKWNAMSTKEREALLEEAQKAEVVVGSKRRFEGDDLSSEDDEIDHEARPHKAAVRKTRAKRTDTEDDFRFMGVSRRKRRKVRGQEEPAKQRKAKAKKLKDRARQIKKKQAKEMDLEK